MRQILVLLLAASLGIGAATLTACGDRSKLVPGNNAREIKRDLQGVYSAVGQHDCTAAAAKVSAVNAAIDKLPSEVDRKLVDNLHQNASGLQGQAAQECRRTPETTSTKTTTTDTQTTPTQTTTTQTDTTPTDTTTTQTDTTPTDTSTQPPGNGGSGGGTQTGTGNGGNGNGGTLGGGNGK